MPCQTDPWTPEELFRYQHGISSEELIRYTCEACRVLEEKKLIDSCSRPLRAWWITHKERDAAHQKELEARRKAEEQRQEALNKLTPHERKLLGIRD